MTDPTPDTPVSPASKRRAGECENNRTQRALRARQHCPAVTADVLTDLLHQLQAIADRVDGRLRLLQHEPDQVFLASALPPLRDRVAAITADARSLRQTALRWVEDSDEPTRAQAEQDPRDQIAGLQAGLAEIRALQPPPGRPDRPTLPGPERGPRA